MNTNVAELHPAQQTGVSLLQRFGDRYGVDPQKMMQTLKATCFRGDVSNEQLMSLLIVADQFKLNPFTKELFAFPDKGGIVPVVSVDGWSRIINEHPQMDGISLEVNPEGTECVAIIHRKDRSHPTRIVEYMSEVNRGTQPWKSHPRRMLRHKALIQCARIAFGFAGIYDEDEAERIVEAKVVDPNEERDNARARAVEALSGSIAVIKAGIAEGTEEGLYKAAEAWFELTDEEKESIWFAPTRNVNGKREPQPHCPWTTAEREVIKSEKFRLAYYTELQDSPKDGEA